MEREATPRLGFVAEHGSRDRGYRAREKLEGYHSYSAPFRAMIGKEK